jgi:hypothetical protein
MMMIQHKETLKQKMQEFKAITEELIESVNKDRDEELDRLFVSRQEIINMIEGLKYNKNDFKAVCEELNIVRLSQELEEVVSKKRMEMREKMNSLKEQRTANRSYIQNSNMIRSVFNKKI